VHQSTKKGLKMQYLFLSVMFSLCIVGMVLTMFGLLFQSITLGATLITVMGFIVLAWCFGDELIQLEKRG
jgi:hypothetical protein